MSNWPMVCLGDAVTFRGGGTPRKDVAEYWSDEIPWATVKDFKSLALSQTQDSISKKGLEASASNLIPAGHVIIPTRMALGKAAINTIDVAINQDLRALVPKQPIDTAYLLHSMLGYSKSPFHPCPSRSGLRGFWMRRTPCGPNAARPSPSSTPFSNPPSSTCSVTPSPIRWGGGCIFPEGSTPGPS
jgi:hypothetical protein